MSNYHLEAVLRALKSVQLSGEPTEISQVYIAHLPHGETIEYLVKSFGLVSKISKSSGHLIVERPPITRHVV